MINISLINDFVEALPRLVFYFIQGYAFLGVYNFITRKNLRPNFKDAIFKVIGISYVLKMLFDRAMCVVNLDFSNIVLYTVLLVLFGALLGYLFGKLIVSNVFDKFLIFLNINRTTNDNFWAGVLENNMYVRVYLKDNGQSYLGIYQRCEEKEREPIIMLRNYQLLDSDDKTLADFSENDRVFVIINTKNFERIEIERGIPLTEEKAGKHKRAKK